MSIQIPLSVRYLVEYVYLSGSIDSGFRTAGSLIEGTRAHQKIQKLYGEQDQKEVHLSAEIPYKHLVFVLDGRCDGLLRSEPVCTIEEIKSTSGDLEWITEDRFPVHWAQAKCYAYMYAREHGIEQMGIQLTYVHVETEEQKQFRQEVTFEQLEQFVLETIKQYAPFAEMVLEHHQARDSSIEALAFPFEAYRQGQRKLAAAVYKSIDDGTKLFAKAPTGIGKTISTIFPTLKAMGRGMLQRFYYLTAKTITRTAAEEALVLLQSKGLHIHSVTLTAKDKICFQEAVSCRKEDCIYADGYYDRINTAILDLMSNETLITRPVIEQYARKHTVCPFEFSLDAAYAADAVICDYNYIFDPRISLKRLLGEQKKQTVLLIDEAHNLVDRAREMFSAALIKSDFLSVGREFKGVNKELQQAAKAVNDYFIAIRKENEAKYRVMQERPQQLCERIEAFVQVAEKQLAAYGSNQTLPLLLDLYYACQAFLRADKLYDERYVTYYEVMSNEVRVKLFCLDPSYLLQQMGKGYRSHIYFSATLSPGGYYMDMLGAGSEDYRLSVPSPFSKDQLKVSIRPLSTRYHDRDRTKGPLVQLLLQLVTNHPGNYLFFFPSYEYMNSVYEAFMSVDHDDPLQTLLQHNEMKEEEREQFLMAFNAANKQTLAGFAVMGGIFSEGIDLVGDRLTGVVVVGVGLPQIGLERNIIKQYYESTGKNGYEYAYVFPGINKVLQAGGRLIRSEHDRGILMLVDDRYMQPRYQSLLPEEWRNESDTVSEIEN
jgi:Rad3-related DNA helicase